MNQEGATSAGYASVGPVLTIQPGQTFAEACRLMVEHQVGSVVVVDPDGKAVGIVTERDVLTAVGTGHTEALARPVEEVMQRDVASCTPDTPTEEVQRLMTERGFRHLPILRDGRAEGMISARDLIRYQHARETEMRHAAEQVANLFSSLHSVDFDEVTNLVTREVPHLMSAGRSVLCLAGESAEGSASGIAAHRWNCPCPDKDLFDRARAGGNPPVAGCTRPPEVCSRGGADEECLYMPLDRPGDRQMDPEDSARAYLCMCDFHDLGPIGRGLLDYNVTLLREAVALNPQSAQVSANVRRAALTDPLTHVGTRRLLEDCLEAECLRASRYGQPFCLAVVDIDHFKEINDRLGHGAGDLALVHVARCMQEELRATDTISRYGGDEFIILLSQTNAEVGVRTLGRICAHVHGLTLRGIPPLTVSIGLAEQAPFGRAAGGELVRRADQALFQAKRAGRNRIERWIDVPESLRNDLLVEQEEVHALQTQVQSLVARSREAFIESVRGLVSALEARDPHTARHSEKVARLSVRIAERMGLKADEIDVIRRSAIVHDIGKIGIPDNILLASGTLTDSQRAVVERHPVTSVRIVDQMSALTRELPIIRQHHERWDGKGYPDGLAGNGICPGARILAVADALDAMTSTRSFRHARCLQDALDALAAGAGTQFDPGPVQALIAWVEEVRLKLGNTRAVAVSDLLDREDAEALQLVPSTAP